MRLTSNFIFIRSVGKADITVVEPFGYAFGAWIPALTAVYYSGFLKLYLKVFTGLILKDSVVSGKGGGC